MAERAALAPLPARRPAGRGALPAHAAARAARRGARLRRPRRVRRALPAPLGAAGALRHASTASRRATTACARSSSRRRAARSSTAHGHVLVDEHARDEPRAAGPPTCRSAGRPSARELRALSAVVDVPGRRRSSPRCKPSRDDPLDAGRRSRARSTRTSTTTSTSTSSSSRACELAETYAAQLPRTASLAAQVLGYVGPDHASGAARPPQREGYQPQDVMGQAGIEASYDRYLKGTDGSARGDRRLARPSRRARSRPTVAAPAGQHAAADARHRPAAGRRGGARATGSTSRTRPPTAPTPTAARSSRSTRRPAPCSRWPRTRPTSRRSS